MSGFMLHGLGDCTPERHCGCLDIPAMTAPEPTPTADEHTDAVARACLLALHDQTCPEGGDCRARWPHAAASGWFDGPRFIRDVSNAAAIHEALAANLPADVMLDALVRAGVLTEERHRVVPSKGARPKRLVTPWEVAP
jgi:hypothetical protein